LSCAALPEAQNFWLSFVTDNASILFVGIGGIQRSFKEEQMKHPPNAQIGVRQRTVRPLDLTTDQCPKNSAYGYVPSYSPCMDIGALAPPTKGAIGGLFGGMDHSLVFVSFTEK
jgi:hypothetical protein